MFSVPNRIFVLIAAAIFMLSGLCFGNCGSDPCGSGDTPANSCHRQPAHEHAAACPHQHLDFAGPQTDGAKANNLVSITILPPARHDLVALDQVLVPLLGPDTGPPVGESRSSTISILRI